MKTVFKSHAAVMTVSSNSDILHWTQKDTERHRMAAAPVEYTIGGVKINFPCKAYPSQLAMMNSVRSVVLTDLLLCFTVNKHVCNPVSSVPYKTFKLASLVLIDICNLCHFVPLRSFVDLTMGSTVYWRALLAVGRVLLCFVRPSHGSKHSLVCL